MDSQGSCKIWIGCAWSVICILEVENKGLLLRAISKPNEENLGLQNN